jgi:hypothetical protein
MIPTKQLGPMVPPYKFQQQPIVSKPFVNQVVPNIRPPAQQVNIAMTPDNLAKNLSELNIQDIEEAASVIFDIVEKDYPK